MKTSVDINWKGNMAFEFEADGHKMTFDADPAVGGEGLGPKPKPFMLYALAGCTGMDVVSILKKMRVDLTDVNVAVEAEMTEDHPKQFTSMHVIYTFTGKDLPLEKLEKAVSLSEERYCGVSAVYKKAIPVSNEIRVVEG